MSVQIIYPADRAAWLAARQQDVTASVAGALIGEHPFTSPYQIWAEKTGRITPDNRSELAHQVGADEVFISPLEMGLFLEWPVVEILKIVRPLWTIEYPLGNRYYRDPKARLGATPDAFAVDLERVGNGVVQIKTISDDTYRREWIDPDTSDVVLPLWIAVQTIIEADLTGSTWACVAVLVRGRSNRLRIIDVPVHAGVKRRVREAVAEFWATVRRKEVPIVDWEKDGPTVLDVYRESTPGRRDLTADEELDVLCMRFDQARGRARSFQQEAEQIRPQIIAALGNHSTGETKSWEITAPTVHRGGHVVQPSTSRTVRLKAKELKHAEDQPF
jgi:hypothetical protein